MTTTVCRMLVLGMVATIALAVDNRAQLAAQESSSGRFRAEAAEALPPPERPATEHPETEHREASTRRPQSVNVGRPYLGITFDPQYADAAVASAVVPGGPADQAGIQPGDSIDAINDRRPVSSYRDAYAIVDACDRAKSLTSTIRGTFAVARKLFSAVTRHRTPVLRILLTTMSTAPIRSDPPHSKSKTVQNAKHENARC